MPKISHKRQPFTNHSLCGEFEGIFIEDNAIYHHRLTEDPVRVTCPACKGKFTKDDVNRIILNNIETNAFIEKNKNNPLYRSPKLKDNNGPIH